MPSSPGLPRSGYPGSAIREDIVQPQRGCDRVRKRSRNPVGVGEHVFVDESQGSPPSASNPGLEGVAPLGQSSVAGMHTQLLFQIASFLSPEPSMSHAPPAAPLAAP